MNSPTHSSKQLPTTSPRRVADFDQPILRQYLSPEEEAKLWACGGDSSALTELVRVACELHKRVDAKARQSRNALFPLDDSMPKVTNPCIGHLVSIPSSSTPRVSHALAVLPPLAVALKSGGSFSSSAAKAAAEEAAKTHAAPVQSTPAPPPAQGREIPRCSSTTAIDLVCRERLESDPATCCSPSRLV